MTTENAFRLGAGGLIDRSQTVSFSFDGRAYNGYAGDTLASALLANGVKLVGRSFKYHRPRGVLTAGSEEPNALVELRQGDRREPNTRATMVELYEGLHATSQNRWPSLSFDVMAVNSLFSPIFVAGFYYKTFMWPAAFWEKVYEPLIRRAAGLGRPSGVADPDHYDRKWAHADLLVIGAGPAGLAACLAAARAGIDVMLVEEDREIGGSLLSERAEIDGMGGAEWLAQTRAELAAAPNVRILTRTSVFGVYDGGTYAAIERTADHLPQPGEGLARQVFWRIVATHAVMATGATDRLPAFGNNDLPGVMLAGAARTYLTRYAAAPGRRMAVFTNNDEGWRTAFVARKAGIEVAGVVDPRDLSSSLTQRAADAGLRHLKGVVSTASGGRAGVASAGVLLAGGNSEILAIDSLAVTAGRNPLIGLASHLGHQPAWDDKAAAFVADRMPPGMAAAGAAAARFGLGEALRSGHEAASSIVSTIRGSVGAGYPMPVAEDEGYNISPLWQVPGKAKAFVDQQHDVTTKDVEIAHREGFISVEHLKRYTTLGMATDQGKTGGTTALAVMAALTGRNMGEAGVPIARPPHVPVAIGALAGRSRDKHFRPVRYTPSHRWAEERGAVFVDVGMWKRAAYYPLPGEKDWLEATTREVRAVRSGVGFCDVSTLGKIDVVGRDAAVFLDRVYANMISTLKVGMTRYGLMLREDGIVYDDGTVARLADDRFFVTTTTANAAGVLQHLEFCRQVLWPDMQVRFATATDQWAQFSVAGPKSRQLIQRLCGEQVDFSNETVPFMAFRDVELIGSMKARVYRISFSGELAYEVAVPAAFGRALAELMMREGADLGVTPYGTEALAVMRIEKGHVAGAELNGNTTAANLGLGQLLSRKKTFIGRVLAQREALVDPARPVLVGLVAGDGAPRLRAGAHIVGDVSEPGPDDALGYVTSVCFSPVMGRWIGLALVSGGRERMGGTVRVYDPLREGIYRTTICSPHFYDPEGVRQRA